MFGNGFNGMINAPDPDRTYTLSTVEIAVPDVEAHALWWDFEIIKVCSSLNLL